MNYVVLKHVLMIFKLRSTYVVMRLKILTHKTQMCISIPYYKIKVCDWDGEKALNCGDQLPVHGGIE